MKKETKVVPTVKPKRGSSRNRVAGHNYERTCKNLLIEAGFPHVVSTRSESRSRDADGIDLINKDEGINGRLPYNIQCKNYTTHLKYFEVLKRIPKIPGIINVIFHKLTTNKGKKNVSGQFIVQGHYAILYKEDFIQMMKDRLELEELRKMQDHFLNPES
jgi:hypothetical protein